MQKILGKIALIYVHQLYYLQIHVAKNQMLYLIKTENYYVNGLLCVTSLNVFFFSINSHSAHKGIQELF